ncbi:MAG: hypothetical protein ABIU06_08580 [Anaerolineales bacterium]
MQKFRSARGILLIYGSFVAISSILILNGILSSPSESDNAVFFGLSIPRLFFALGLLIAFFLFTSITVKVLRHQEWAEKILKEWFGTGRFSKVTMWLAAISFGLGWIGCFLPSYRVGTLVNYWIAIRPLMIFILIASLSTLTVIFIKRNRLMAQDLKISRTHYLAFILFLACTLILVIMLTSGFGIRTLDDFWYGAGVPILASQLIAALLGGILFLQMENRLNWRRSDLIVFLLIYTATAILWIREPLQKSFLFTGPYPPNHVLYPFVDSAIFDTASQFALIGQGIFNGQFFERSLYVSFLIYLHSLFDQDYDKLMAIQAGIFAIFPALIYFIGRSLNVRAIGFAAAIIAVLRGINSIAASNMIDMANPKMLLTDFPTAIGMALIILLTCEWLKMPIRKLHYALWIGGAIGFTLMLRTNALVLLLFIPVYVLFKFLPEWKKWLISVLFIILGMIAITLPWELRNQARGGIIYGSYLVKFQNVIKQRYIPPSEPSGSLPQQGMATVSFKNTQVFLDLSHGASYRAQGARSCDTVICFAPNHFLHNIVTALLILPTSPLLDDLRHTVKDAHPYWQPDWDGYLTPSSLFFLILNVFFIALGISLAWHKLRLNGLTPLAVFIFYNISNALARTSGGRYLVPMDWIVSIYFLLGVFWLITWFADAIGVKWDLFAIPNNHDIPQKINSLNFRGVIAILSALFGLGSLIPLSENFYPPRYQNMDVRQTLIDHKQEIAKAGISTADIDLFLKNSNAEILVGRILYPRYYPMDRGEFLFDPFVTMGFPRTAFTLIGPQGERGVILPGSSPDHFPHAVDAIVLGCKEEKYLDALAVILLDESGAIYTRAPKSDLQCPLKQPVCNNNRVCQ